MKLTKKKPRVPFCWHCGRMLYARRVYAVVEAEGHRRIVHKACARLMEGDDGVHHTPAQLRDLGAPLPSEIRPFR